MEMEMEMDMAAQDNMKQPKMMSRRCETCQAMGTIS